MHANHVAPRPCVQVRECSIGTMTINIMEVTPAALGTALEPSGHWAAVGKPVKEQMWGVSRAGKRCGGGWW